MKNSILFLLVIVICSLGCKKEKSENTPILTSEQIFENAAQKIKNKKFVLDYAYWNYGWWIWDSTINNGVILDSIAYSGIGDTLVLKTSSQTDHLYFDLSPKGLCPSSIIGSIITSYSADSTFFPKLYTNQNNESFIGFKCCIPCHGYVPCGGTDAHALVSHNHDFDTINASSFRNYNNFINAISWMYKPDPYIEVQYYYDKDSIVLFHSFTDGGFPVDIVRRGYAVLYGHQVN